MAEPIKRLAPKLAGLPHGLNSHHGSAIPLHRPARCLPLHELLNLAADRRELWMLTSVTMAGAQDPMVDIRRHQRWKRLPPDLDEAASTMRVLQPSEYPIVPLQRAAMQ